MIKCPCCKGEGGYRDDVVEYLPGHWDGPYYPCEYCRDKTTVNPWKWLTWMLECEWKWSGKLFELYYDWRFKNGDYGD